MFRRRIPLYGPSLALGLIAGPAIAATPALPFTREAGQIVVAVALNHASPVPFLFAPYAPGVLAATARLTPSPAGTVAIARLEAGPFARRGVTFALAPLAALAPALGFQPAGILGAALTEGQSVTIDYQAGRITIPAAPAPPAATCLPWPANQAEPTIPITLDGRTLMARIAPDLPGALYLPQAGLTHMAQSQPARPLVIGFAAAAPVWALVNRGGALTIAGQTLAAPLLETPIGAAAITMPSLGNQILARFTLTLDPGARRICLAANARAGRPMRFDRSGITLTQSQGESPVIEVVAPATPAAEAGLHPGQRLLAINGRLTRHMTLDAVRARLSRPGRLSLFLTIATGNSRPRRLRLTLSDLS